MYVDYYTQDFGEIHTGQEISRTYDFIDTVKIIDVKSGCPKCTKVIVKGNKVIVKYKGQSIPKHLLDNGYYYVNKMVNVTFIDTITKTRQSLTLFLTGKIVK